MGTVAENVAASLRAGDRVIVSGSTYLESYRDATGDQRTKQVLDAEAIGVSVPWRAT